MLKFIVLLFTLTIYSQGQDQFVYKKIDTLELKMDVYYPPNLETTKTYPAMVFFFGGGWKTGGIGQFKTQAEYLAKRGMVCFLADYRIATKHNTTPFESLKDAKSAIRFVREHAGTHNVNPNKIVASGGSAGGHLAAATALISGFNEDTDTLAVSAVPNALVLFNPVIDNGPGGYGFDRVGEAYTVFSPLHNIQKGAPPTLILTGTEDHLVPVETVKYYQTVMEKVGSRCDLKLYKGAKHGFFNHSKGADNYNKTVAEMDAFLSSLGYLK